MKNKIMNNIKKDWKKQKKMTNARALYEDNTKQHIDTL